MIGTDGIRASTHGHETEELALFQPFDDAERELTTEELAKLEDRDEPFELEISEEHLRQIHEKTRANWLRQNPDYRPDPNASVLVPSSAAKTPPTVAEIELDASQDASLRNIEVTDIDLEEVFVRPSRPSRPLPLIPCGRALNMNLHSLATAKVDTCRYPIDTGSEHFFCAEIVKENSSYCPEHHAACMVKPTKSQEKSLARHVVDDGYVIIKAPTTSEPPELVL